MRKCLLTFSLMMLFGLVLIPVANAQEYVVKSGDNLWDISRKYHISVAQLKSMNHLSSKELDVGQKLVVPDIKQKAVQNKEIKTVAPTVPVDRGDRPRDPATLQPASVAAVADSQPVEPSRGDILRRSVIARSYACLGSPYRYGGTSPKGFDCSGFVGYVYRLCGITLPRDSASQSRKGIHVEQGDLIAGDLVFFHTGGSKGINHVGIYIGNGKFIHASIHQGIAINSLGSAYYRKCYAGARRIII